MTGGVAFEALHQAGGAGTPMVVVLNDNGMSIAPNVGALSRYFTRVRLHPKLWHTRENMETRLSELPGVGRRIERYGPQMKESIKAFWAPGLLWEELGWAYTGVIDGHDVRALRIALRSALAAERPVLVHIATVKGKGFAPAEDGGQEGQERWHAAKPKSIMDGVVAAPAMPKLPKPPPQFTTVFGEALVKECIRDRRVVGITAAMNTGTGLNILQKAMPERYFDVGIAEQQAILFAAGLALEGVKPVAAIYSTFLQRAYDQIVHDVCLQKLNVVFALDRAGLVGDDGPTHHGVFDIAYMRPLPNIVLMAPRDEAMLVHMLRTALLYDDGPIALRYPRGEALGVPIPTRADPIAIGTGEILREGDGKVAIVGYGTGVAKGIEAADRLSDRGLDVTVVDARFAKPIDAPLMAQLATEHELLVTDRGGRAGRRLRQRRVGVAQRRRRARRADHARRHARPLRHARHARDPACRGRLHRQADRRAHRGGADGARRRRLLTRAAPRNRKRPALGETGRFRGGEALLCGCDAAGRERVSDTQAVGRSLRARRLPTVSWLAGQSCVTLVTQRQPIHR